MDTKKYILIILILVVYLLAGCTKQYVLKLRSAESHKSSVIKNIGRDFSYDDSLLTLYLQSERIWYIHSNIVLKLVDKKDTGLIINLKQIKNFGEGLWLNSYNIHKYEDKYVYNHFPYPVDAKSAQSSYLIDINPYGVNLNSGQSSYLIDIDNNMANKLIGKGRKITCYCDRERYKTIFDICFSDSSVYKTFEIYSFLEGEKDKPVFVGYNPDESFYDFKMTFNRESSKTNKAFYYNIIMSIKNDKNWPHVLNEKNIEVVVDSLSVSCLNYDKMDFPKISKIEKNSKRAEYFYNDIEIPIDEDMIRIEFIIYLLNKENGLRYHVIRYNKPILIIPAYLSSSSRVETQN